jgi:hypothetical protein
MIFICWFGASGYLLTRLRQIRHRVSCWCWRRCAVWPEERSIFFFLAKVLLPYERELTDFETAVTGVVGRVSAAIRPGVTGEIVYEQMGARRSAPARSEDGNRFPNRKRSLSCATREESHTYGVGTKCWRIRS